MAATSGKAELAIRNERVKMATKSGKVEVATRTTRLKQEPEVTS